MWQLHSYSPVYNPIEYLWCSTKQEAMHNLYLAQFDHLTSEVERALVWLATEPARVLQLFARYYQEMELARQTLQLAA